MSELKVHKAYNRWLDEEMPTPNDDLICNEVYLKSEADKAIAEKDAEIARLKAIRKVHVEAIESMGAGLLQDEEENRNSKYKRCLAMAEMCDARHDEEDTKVNGHGASWEYKSKEMKYWERWHNRWLAIAEKFKPN